MHLTSVELTDFRNYEALSVQLAPGVTLLHGPNAAGKSSFLEAITMLATGRSGRARAPRELVRLNSEGTLGFAPLARIAVRVQRQGGGAADLDLVIQPTGQSCRLRRRYNRRTVSARELAGKLLAVLFRAEDLALVSGAPAGRRNYLDLILLQSEPGYTYAYSRYREVLAQRNKLLRGQAKGQAPTRQEFAFWNRELARHGAALVAARRSLLVALAPHLGQAHHRLAGNAAQLALAYRSTVPELPPDEAGRTATFRQAMAASWSQEMAHGTTLIGPHRDDVSFLLDDVDLATYGSRGQQRTAIVALTLALVELLQVQTGEPPVILLDDVMSELDPARRQRLQAALLAESRQVLITTTSLHGLEPLLLEQAATFCVQAGQWTVKE